jgi:membrane fusion protein (multidrug efflux system)
MLALACIPYQLLAEDKDPEPEVLVQTALIDQVTLRSTVTVYGTIEPEPATEGRPAAQFTLTAPYAGLVSELAAVEGARVEKGTCLLRLDARLADAAITKARTKLGFAQKTQERQKKLAEVDGTSAKLIEEAAKLVADAEQELREVEAQRSLLDVSCPVAGTVTRVYAHAGQPVEAGQRLVELLDSNRLVLKAAVPTRELASLKLGLKAEITPSSGGKPIHATVTYISPEADVQTDTIPLRLTLPPGCGLRPGQFAAARIASEEKPDCLVVPRSSLFTDRDGTSAVSLAKDGRSKRVQVTVGVRDGDLVEISGDGIQKGATVVTVGSYALPDGTRLLMSEKQAKGGVQ